MSAAWEADAIMNRRQNSDSPNWACQRTTLADNILHLHPCRDGGIGRRSGLKIHRPTKACEFESRSRHNYIRRLRLLAWAGWDGESSDCACFVPFSTDRREI